MITVNCQCLMIQPVDNGWLLKIVDNFVDYGSGISSRSLYVFISQKDLGRFVEEFYTKKDDH